MPYCFSGGSDYHLNVFAGNTATQRSRLIFDNNGFTGFLKDFLIIVVWYLSDIEFTG